MSEPKKRDRSSEKTPEYKAKKKEYFKKYYHRNKQRILENMKKQYDRVKPPSTRRDWRLIIDQVREELADYKKLNIKPTLRTMFYRLYSKHIIENTRWDYGMLSEKTTIAREASIKSEQEQKNSYYGIIPIDSFSDEKRVATRFSSELDDWQPDKYISDWVNNLKILPSVYVEQLLPRWINQPHYIEIWTEKSAMLGTFREVIGNRQVDIVPFSGQPSVSYLWENAKRLKLFQELGKKIHIFYYGDFDPSGENIEETIRKKLSLYGVNDIDFRRIALTQEQIRL